MEFKFDEIFNIPELEKLCESFTQINGTVTALLDLEGKVYISTGWQQACTLFHRKHPICSKACTESDTILASKAKNNSKYNMYKCKNGLFDVSIPIYIKNEHVGNFFTGQFLLEPPNIDYFRRQAKQFGFDEQEYLSAIKKVPVFSEKEIKKSALFLAHLTEHIGETGLKNIEIIETTKKLKDERKKFKSLFEDAKDAIILIYPNGVFFNVNKSACNLFKLSENDFLGKSVVDLSTKKQYNGEDSAKKAERLIGLCLNGQPQNFEWLHCDSSGNTIDTSVSLNTIELSGEIYLQAVIRDITEQKQTEIKLIREKERAEESEYFLQESQRTGKIGSYKLDFSTGYWISTKFLDDIFGIDDSFEKNIPNWFELVHPEDREVLFDYFQNEVIDKRQDFDNEYRIIRESDKKTRWLHGVGKLYFDEDNNLTVMLGTIQDITERKNYEIKLQNEQKRFKALADNVPGSIYLCENDANYTMLYLNEGIKQILGYDREVFLSGKMHFTDIYHPDDIDTIFSLVDIAVENRTSFELLFRIKHKNGDWRWIHEYGTGIYKNDKLDYLIGFLIDVTKEKHDEEELLNAKKNAEEREFFLRESQRVGNIGSFKMDLQTNEIFTTESIDEIFGFDENFTKTINTWIELIHPEERKKVETYFQNEVIGKKRPFEYEYRIIREKDKTVRWIYSLGKLYFDDENNITHIMGIIQDISERKIIEEERRAMNRTLENNVKERTIQLQQANQDLESFAYSVSHDLRAPIRHIIGFTSLLEKTLNPMDEETRNYIEKILLSSKNMSVMIDELLKFSRLGRAKIKYNSVDLSTIIPDIVAQLKPDYEGRNIVWKIRKLPKVHGDVTLLRIAFENLISNAIKYSAKKEQAIIEIGQTEKPLCEEVCVFVKDNGAGFDIAYKQKLFSVFQRLHKDEEFEGVGIGLANVQQIIKKHNGTIDAESEINKGATFYISLPKLN